MVDNHAGDNPAPNSDQGENAPKYVTAEELARTVNAAISNRLKSFDKKLDEFAAKLTPPKEEEQVSEEKLTLKKLQSQLEAIKAERDNEVQKRKDTDLRVSLSDALKKAGVSDIHMKAAMAVLIHEDKAVSYNDDGDLVFVNKDTGESVDLVPGVKTWIKTSDGKNFLPASGAQGSGDSRYNSGKTPQNTEMSDEAIVQGLLGAL